MRQVALARKIKINKVWIWSHHDKKWFQVPTMSDIQDAFLDRGIEIRIRWKDVRGCGIEILNFSYMNQWLAEVIAASISTPTYKVNAF